MKRALLMVGACVAALGLGATSASGSVVNRTVEKCEVDAQWQFTLDFGGASYIDITSDSLPTGCKAFNAFVENDGNFRINSEDTGHLWTTRWDFTWAGVSAAPTVIAGLAKYQGGPDLGAVKLAGSALHANIAAVAADGYQAVAEYHGTESCGPNCYQARGVYENAHHPGP
jgi:hypothetical protein